MKKTFCINKSTGVKRIYTHNFEAVPNKLQLVRLTRSKHLFLATHDARGRAKHFHLGGLLEGPVLQQGELSMVCVGLSERDLKNFGGASGPPSSAPA